MNRPPRARSRRHPDGKGRARNRPIVTRLTVTGSAVASPALHRPHADRPVIDWSAVDQPRVDQPVIDRPERDRPEVDGPDVAAADARRPWWFARAMYGVVVMVGLGAALVWLSTGGVLAIAVTVVAAATAIPAITLARREPREAAKND